MLRAVSLMSDLLITKQLLSLMRGQLRILGLITQSRTAHANPIFLGSFNAKADTLFDWVQSNNSFSSPDRPILAGDVWQYLPTLPT
jgi:hypothetical protein